MRLTVKELKKEPVVRIIKEGSAFFGLTGIVKEARQGGGLLVEIKPHGKLYFSESDCEQL